MRAKKYIMCACNIMRMPITLTICACMGFCPKTIQCRPNKLYVFFAHLFYTILPDIFYVVFHRIFHQFFSPILFTDFHRFFHRFFSKPIDVDNLFWPNLSFEIFHAVKLSQWNEAPVELVGGSPNLNNFFEFLIYFSEPINVDVLFWPNLT